MSIHQPTLPPLPPSPHMHAEPSNVVLSKLNYVLPSPHMHAEPSNVVLSKPNYVLPSPLRNNDDQQEQQQRITNIVPTVASSFYYNEDKQQPPIKIIAKNTAKPLKLSLSSITNDIHRIWEVPYICHFTWLYQQRLRMNAITPDVCEFALMNLTVDNEIAELFSRLIMDSQRERTKLPRGRSFSLAMLDDILKCIFDDWLQTKDEYVMPKPFIFPFDDNPLDRAKLCDLDVQMCIKILKALCDSRQLSEEFHQFTREILAEDLRVQSFGTDSLNNRYYYFGFGDCRVYIQNEAMFRVACFDMVSLNALMKSIRKSRKQCDRELLRQFNNLVTELKAIETQRKKVEDRLLKRKAAKELDEARPRKRSSRLAKLGEKRLQRVGDTPPVQLTVDDRIRMLALEWKSIMLGNGREYSSSSEEEESSSSDDDDDEDDDEEEDDDDTVEEEEEEESSN